MLPNINKLAGMTDQEEILELEQDVQQWKEEIVSSEKVIEQENEWIRLKMLRISEATQRLSELKK